MVSEPVLLCEEDLQGIYNKSGIPERISRGELRKVVHPRLLADPAKILHPAGTKGVVEKLYEPSNRLVAVLYWYELPNGKVGGAGLKDPKLVWLGGVELKLDAKRRRPTSGPRPPRNLEPDAENDGEATVEVGYA